MNETIRGMTVKKSAFEVLDYFEIREATDFVIKLLGLKQDVFKGVTIRSLEKNQTSAGTYASRTSTITLYRHTNAKSKLYRKSILIHELMHALQHKKNGIGFSVYDETFATIDAKTVRMYRGKYFSNPIELEAFATQYHYLQKNSMEVIAAWWVEQYEKLGINLGEVATSIYGK